jgi:hypothetical protein
VTDDIVTRLKVHRGECNIFGNTVINDAIFEIWRLRKELSETQIKCLYWREIVLELQDNAK